MQKTKHFEDILNEIKQTYGDKIYKDGREIIDEVHKNIFELKKFNSSINDGLSGLLLYCCDYWSNYQDEKAKTLSKWIFIEIINRFLYDNNNDYSLLNGNSGVVLSITHYFSIFGINYDFYNKIKSKLLINQNIILTKNIDNSINDGRCGILLSLIYLVRLNYDIEIIKIINGLIINLVSDIKIMGHGIYLSTNKFFKRPPIGYLNGICGIELVLLMLHENSNSGSFLFLINSLDLYVKKEILYNNWHAYEIPDIENNSVDSPNRNALSLLYGHTGLLINQLKKYEAGIIEDINLIVDKYLLLVTKYEFNNTNTSIGLGSSGVVFALILINKIFDNSVYKKFLFNYLQKYFLTNCDNQSDCYSLIKGYLGKVYTKIIISCNYNLFDTSAINILFNCESILFKKKSTGIKCVNKESLLKIITHNNLKKISEYVTNKKMLTYFKILVKKYNFFNQYHLFETIQECNIEFDNTFLNKLISYHTMLAVLIDETVDFYAINNKSISYYETCREISNMTDDEFRHTKFKIDNENLILNISDIPYNTMNKMLFKKNKIDHYIKVLTDNNINSFVNIFKVNVYEGKIFCETEDLISKYQFILLNHFDKGPNSIAKFQIENKNLNFNSMKIFVFLLVRIGVLIKEPNDQ